jgi:hypothetical protein
MYFFYHHEFLNESTEWEWGAWKKARVSMQTNENEKIKSLWLGIIFIIDTKGTECE